MHQPTDSTFRDSVIAHASRARLDELLLEALAAPGLGVEAAQQVADYVNEGHLKAGTDALQRVRSATGVPADDGAVA